MLGGLVGATLGSALLAAAAINWVGGAGGHSGGLVTRFPARRQFGWERVQMLMRIVTLLTSMTEGNQPGWCSQIRRTYGAQVFLVVFFWVSLSSCGQQITPTLTPTNTPVPTATDTPRPTATLTPIPTLTPTPTPLGGGSKIAFSSNRDGNYNVYVMNSDGTAQTRFTEAEVDEFNPEFSPSGDLIAFWARDLAASPPIYELVIMTKEGEVLATVGYSLGYSSWSPDGDEVAVDALLEAGNSGIVRARVDGSRILGLTRDPAGDLQPDWSPDGGTIAFISLRDGTPRVYLMNADGTSQRRLTTEDIVQFEPDWSPDGMAIAFTSGDNANTQIYIVNADGTNIRQVTDSPGFNEHPAWSPDGTMLAFWSDRTGNREIYAVRLDGTALVQLTDDPAQDENPSWSSQ